MRGFKQVADFGGIIVGCFIAIADTCAIIGMPWTPNLDVISDRWIIALIALISFLGCFAAGWMQRGIEYADKSVLERATRKLEAANFELELTKRHEKEVDEIRSHYELEAKTAEITHMKKIDEMREELDKAKGIASHLKSDLSWYEGKYGRRKYE